MQMVRYDEGGGWETTLSFGVALDSTMVSADLAYEGVVTK